MEPIGLPLRKTIQFNQFFIKSSKTIITKVDTKRNGETII